MDYGVSCNYGSKSDEDLQMSLTGSFMMQVPPVAPVAPAKEISLSRTITSMINAPMTKGYATLPFPTYAISETDLETLHRFQERTVCTVGTQDSWMMYRDVVVRLACHVGDPVLPSYKADMPKVSISHAYRAHVDHDA